MRLNFKDKAFCSLKTSYHHKLEMGLSEYSIFFAGCVEAFLVARSQTHSEGLKQGFLRQPQRNPETETEVWRLRRDWPSGLARIHCGCAHRCPPPPSNVFHRPFPLLYFCSCQLFESFRLPQPEFPKIKSSFSNDRYPLWGERLKAGWGIGV